MLFIFNEIKFFIYFLRFLYNVFIIDLIKPRNINIEQFECNTKMAHLLNKYHNKKHKKIIKKDLKKMFEDLQTKNWLIKLREKKDEEKHKKRYLRHIKDWIRYSHNNFRGFIGYITFPRPFTVWGIISVILGIRRYPKFAPQHYIFRDFVDSEKDSLARIFRLKEFMYPFSYIKNLIFNGYYFNEIYNYYLYKNKKLSFNLMKNLDRGLIEYIGHLFIVNFINRILFFFSKKYPGRIDHFVFIIIVGIILINILLILWYILVDYKIFCLLFMVAFVRTLHKINNWRPVKEFAIWLLVTFYNETNTEQYYVKQED